MYYPSTFSKLVLHGNSLPRSLRSCFRFLPQSLGQNRTCGPVMSQSAAVPKKVAHRHPGHAKPINADIKVWPSHDVTTGRTADAITSGLPSKHIWSYNDRTKN